MDKLNKLSWPVVILTALVIILLIVVYNLGQESNKESSTVSKPEIQSQIASCAKQAQIVLVNEQKKDEIVRYSQTNHYNNSLKKCLVDLSSSISDAMGVLFTNEVRDAYEQKTFISCASGSAIKKSYCFIPGNYSSSGKAVFMTEDEGNAQIQNYMNN